MTQTRTQATLILLRTRLDADIDPAPAHRVATPSGFAEKRRCPHCKGTGRLIGGRDQRKACNRCKRNVERPHGCVPCDHFETLASGVKVVCEDGLLQTDEYLTEKGKRELGVTGRDRFMTDDELQRWAGEAHRDLALRAGKVDQAYANLSNDRAAIEVALTAGKASTAPGQIRVHLSGDYQALDRALELLRTFDERLHAAVRNAHMLAGGSRYPSLDRWLQRRADRGVVLVAARMPATITVPHWAVQVAGRQNRLSVEEMLAAGWKVARIAREVRLSEQRVKVLRKAWLAGKQPVAA